MAKIARKDKAVGAKRRYMGDSLGGDWLVNRATNFVVCLSLSNGNAKGATGCTLTASGCTVGVLWKRDDSDPSAQAQGGKMFSLRGGHITSIG
jgi:hypothetical protein